MFPSLFGDGADVLRPIFPTTVTNTARTPAGVSFERLSQASGLQITDRLLAIGILSAEALGALVAMGNGDDPDPARATVSEPGASRRGVVARHRSDRTDDAAPPLSRA